MKQILGLFLLNLLYMLPAQAYFAHQENPEQITRFVSNITINPDASIHVIETIQIRTNQTQMKYGLIRWLPIQDIDNKTFSTLYYQFNHVLLNNVETPYHIVRNDQRYILDITDKKKLLAPGAYTYTIEYTVANVVTFLDNADEFTWNITGNDWPFPIQYAEANITVPNGANVLQYNTYIGNNTDKFSFFEASLPRMNNIIFHSTQPLILHRGMFISILWTKGFITPPSRSDQLKITLANNATSLWLLTGLLTVLSSTLLIYRSHRKTKTQRGY